MIVISKLLLIGTPLAHGDFLVFFDGEGMLLLAPSIHKLVEGVRWATAAKTESDERKNTEHLGIVVVSYLARDSFLFIYKVIYIDTLSNRMPLREVASVGADNIFLLRS